MVPDGLEANGLSEEERDHALSRFRVLRPFLDDGVALARIAEESGLNLRTLRRWVRQYRERGMAGLCRKARADKSKRRMSQGLQEVIEGLALQKPPLSAAMVHRRAVAVARQLGQPAPSYRNVHLMIQKLNPALVTLAHGGSKDYSETFDLVYRREVEAPNAVWQADHTELDVWVMGEDGGPSA
jgi:putative transposase